MHVRLNDVAQPYGRELRSSIELLKKMVWSICWSFLLGGGAHLVVPVRIRVQELSKAESSGTFYEAKLVFWPR